MEQTVLIVGGGLVGSLAAVHLAQRGFHVILYERRPDIRHASTLQGHRSINLALSARGISALSLIGIQAEIMETVIPMHARMIHRGDGGTEAQAYGTFGEAINSVDRRLLNMRLLDRAEMLANVQIKFEHSLKSIKMEEGSAVFVDERTGEEYTVHADHILGCDGAYSTLRQQLMKLQPIDFEQKYIKHGYKELCIMPDETGKARIPVNYLHIWPRKDFMLIALPNQDNSFTVTLFYPYEQLKEMKTSQQVLNLFEEHFPDALDLIGRENLLHDFFENPASPLVSIKMSKFNYKDKVLLMGDAIHAMVPFYGQGMNAGFEDVEVLSKLIDEHDGDLGKAISAFTDRRRPDAHAICDLAWYNYTEMSTLVLSRTFRAQKKLYSWLHWAAPKTFVPLYTMVSFSQIPYSRAVEKKEREDRLVASVGGALVVGVLGAIAYKLFNRP